MARKPRRDGPDTWHHVMNRGLARRTLFENDADRRFFLHLVAREVRAGRIELHAFSLMLTHFHLLVRSIKGELSKALKRLQNRYSRWFNRTRRRDGPLYKGRFLSCPVEDLAYRRNVVTYIHDNAVEAGLVADPAAYEWSSAHHFALERRPPWLEQSWIDSELARRGRGHSLAERLASAFPCRTDPDFRRWIESSLSRRLPEELEDLRLKYAGSPRVVRWAIRKARLADGTKPFQPYCPPQVVVRATRRAVARIGPLLGRFRRAFKDAWLNLGAGLLRLLAGCTHREIGLRLGRHGSTVSRDLRDHERLMHSDKEYETIFSRIAHAALEAVR